MKKISVIIPAYNREKYIEKCLLSLLEQDYPNIEIVVVDNNSTDKTVEIVKKVIKAHPEVHLYYCKKQGVSCARNLGIDKATGDYVAFVDSDDYCKPGMFSALYRQANSNNSDIAICNIEQQDEAGNILPEENRNSGYKGKNCVKKYLCSPISCCGKLIKKSYLDENHIRFREDLSLAEDLVFSLELATRTEQISYVNQSYYVYYYQANSLMHHIDSEREYQIFEALGYIYGIYDKKNHLLEKYHDEIERIFISNLVLSASTRYMLPEGDASFYEQALSFMKSHFPNWHKNKYYQQRGMKMKVFFYLYRHGQIMKFRKLITRIRG